MEQNAFLKELGNLVARFSGTNQSTNPQVIAQGNAQTRYKELSYTIASGEAVEIFEVFNYFRILSQSASTVSVQFGDDPNTSAFSGAGLGIRFENLPNRLVIRNTGGVSTTITIALAIGFIYDDRLNVSGTVTVSGTVAVSDIANIQSPASLITIADVAVAATTTTLVLAANTNRKEAFISNLAANGTPARVGDSNTGVARGAEMAAGSTAVITSEGAIYVYNPTGASINIGVAYTE